MNIQQSYQFTPKIGDRIKIVSDDPKQFDIFTDEIGTIDDTDNDYHPRSFSIIFDNPKFHLKSFGGFLRNQIELLNFNR